MDISTKTNSSYREKLTNDFVRPLLSSVRDNGWLTHISEDVGFNRNEFNEERLARMTLRRLLRLLVSLCEYHSQQSNKGWFKLWNELGMIIYQMAEDNYDELCNERRKRKKANRH